MSTSRGQTENEESLIRGGIKRGRERERDR